MTCIGKRWFTFNILQSLTHESRYIHLYRIWKITADHLASLGGSSQDMKWLGSPPFISQNKAMDGRGPTTLLLRGRSNDHHGQMNRLRYVLGWSSSKSLLCRFLRWSVATSSPYLLPAVKLAVPMSSGRTETIKGILARPPPKLFPPQK